MARSMVSTGALQGYFDPTVAPVCAIDAEPSAKARYLRELAAPQFPDGNRLHDKGTKDYSPRPNNLFRSQ